MAPVVLAITGSDVAFSQSGTGTAAQASLYTAIDLHSSGFDSSIAIGVSGGQQVGYGVPPASDGHQGLLWRGSAASKLNLNPGHEAEATATCGGQQVGYGGGFGVNGTERHALLWRGSAASVVDLHPRGFDASEAHGTSGREQVGFGSSATRGFHALLWRGSAASAVDLHPRGFSVSEAVGTDGEEQVGDGYGAATGGVNHALLWRGSAGSVVDLHPRGFDDSNASGTSGGQQVGWGRIIPADIPGGMAFHALLWRGSADSVVDLNPRGVIDSEARGTNGEEQVGIGRAIGAYGHALLWRGSAASVVDLHTFLPSGFVFSNALGIDATGDIVGSAAMGHRSPAHAILWKRNVPKPGTSRGHKTTRC
jgi:hypothetical protein